MEILEIYFSSVDDGENIARVSNEVESKVNTLSIDDVERVTPEVIRSAAKKLKPGKSDPVYSFSSDCIKVDSTLLSEYLSILIKCFLVHGHVSRFLLLAFSNASLQVTSCHDVTTYFLQGGPHRSPAL